MWLNGTSDHIQLSLHTESYKNIAVKRSHYVQSWCSSHCLLSSVDLWSVHCLYSCPHTQTTHKASWCRHLGDTTVSRQFCSTNWFRELLHFFGFFLAVWYNIVNWCFYWEICFACNYPPPPFLCVAFRTDKTLFRFDLCVLLVAYPAHFYILKFQRQLKA